MKNYLYSIFNQIKTLTSTMHCQFKVYFNNLQAVTFAIDVEKGLKMQIGSTLLFPTLISRCQSHQP